MSNMRANRTLALITSLALCGLGGFESAMAVMTGEIAGTVLTLDGAPLPGALIEAASEKLMGTMTTTSAEGGQFRLLMLPPGTYKVTVRADGFGDKTVAGIVVLLGKTTAIEAVRLEPQRFAEQVTVTASRPLLDTASTTIGGNLPAREFDALPVGRAYQTLATLVPGVSLDLAAPRRRTATSSTA
jgi:hypothetical protein